MSRALADAALTRPRAMLAATLAVLVLAAVLAARAADRVPLAPPEAARSESERAADELGAALGQGPGPGVLIVSTGRQPVESAVYRVALDVISSRAETAPDVAEVRRGAVSRDGRTTVLEVYFRDDDPRPQQEAVDDLRAELDPGPLEVAVGGQAAVLRDARDGLWGELGPLALLALPVTVLVLALVLGLRLAAAPVLAAATGLLGALGLIGLLNEVTPLSVLGVAPAAVIALALGIESCLMLNDRYRDEVAALGATGDALRRTLDTAGRAVTWSTLGAAAVAASLAVIPVLDARSAALGGALAALITGAVALVAMPSILVLSRPAVAEGEESATAVGGAPAEEGVERGLAYRLESLLMRRRPPAALLAASASAALLAIASPGLRAELLPIEATGLPDEAEAHRAEVRSTAELGAETTAPVLASADPAGRAELKSYRFELARVPGVSEARGPSGADSGPELLRAGTEARPGSPGARDAVEGIRDVPAPVSVSVGGRDAEALDAARAFLGWLPIAAAVAMLLLAVLLYAVLRPALASRLRTALPAVALAAASMLPSAAAGGVLVLVFQDSRLTDPLDYAPQGGPALAAAVATVGAVAAISAARTVHLVAALAVERKVGFPWRVAVPLATELTLPGAAAATLVAGAATIVLAGAELVPAKEFGLATAAGLILDLVLVRAVLAPALARVSE
jgi:RND superfamily putative drug exporter